MIVDMREGPWERRAQLGLIVYTPIHDILSINIYKYLFSFLLGLKSAFE